MSDNMRGRALQPLFFVTALDTFLNKTICFGFQCTTKGSQCRKIVYNSFRSFRNHQNRQEHLATMEPRKRQITKATCQDMVPFVTCNHLPRTDFDLTWGVSFTDFTTLETLATAGDDT